MPGKSAHVKNERQYEALRDKGMSKERAAKIANSPDASRHGGEKSGSGATPPRAERPLRRKPPAGATAASASSRFAPSTMGQLVPPTNPLEKENDTWLR